MPGLPPDPDQRPAPGALVAWMLGGAIPGLVVIAVVTLVAGGPGPVFLACVLAALFAVVGPLLLYRSWRYAVREDEIDLRRGILVVRRTIVPMVRVQHVDTSVTALGRLFGVATLTVHTAAGRHEIPGLAVATADRLRTEIARAIREPDDV
jgi:membrane protein YdbS with pleckstrin-like domain